MPSKIIIDDASRNTDLGFSALYLKNGCAYEKFIKQNVSQIWRSTIYIIHTNIIVATETEIIVKNWFL